ncbi:hypothetical protein AHiyo1_27380 [Arthrobacter sp. Hiyo1]|nr:hypothetical protein AHiyo1_27380 [Arthrobacter sp. Hiyo1]
MGGVSEGDTPSPIRPTRKDSARLLMLIAPLTTAPADWPSLDSLGTSRACCSAGRYESDYTKCSYIALVFLSRTKVIAINAPLSLRQAVGKL